MVEIAIIMHKMLVSLPPYVFSFWNAFGRNNLKELINYALSIDGQSGVQDNDVNSFWPKRNKRG